MAMYRSRRGNGHPQKTWVSTLPVLVQAYAAVHHDHTTFGKQSEAATCITCSHLTLRVSSAGADY